MNRLVRFFSLMMLGAYTFSLFLLPVSAQSVTATFALSPRTKNVVLNSTFDVTINIKSTAAKQISYARAVLFFDPSLLEIPQALEAGNMFCNYPTDSANYVADNDQGQIVITGISTGNAGCEYPEITTANSLFARVTFKAKKTGTAELSFMYNGQLADDMTAITDTNSPPQFIMSTPQDGSYKITSTAVTATPKPPGNLGVDPRIIIGVAFGLMAIGWYFYPRKTTVQRVVASTEAW